jgi:hypothetical protein
MDVVDHCTKPSDFDECIHGGEECLGHRYFVCAQNLTTTPGMAPSYSDTTRWLDFQSCSYGECSKCDVFTELFCLTPCTTYTTFTKVCMHSRVTSRPAPRTRHSPRCSWRHTHALSPSRRTHTHSPLLQPDKNDIMKNCAEDFKIDWTALQTCANGPDGAALLQASARKSRQQKAAYGTKVRVSTGCGPAWLHERARDLQNVPGVYSLRLHLVR